MPSTKKLAEGKCGKVSQRLNDRHDFIMFLSIYAQNNASPGVELINKAKELDKFYIPSRYPNAHPQGAPFEYYTKDEAEKGIIYGEAIISFCEDSLL